LPYSFDEVPPGARPPLVALLYRVITLYNRKMYRPLEKSWQQALQAEFDKPYWMKLHDRINRAYQSETIYPRYDDIYAALDVCPLPSVNVVIIGQDPYHGPDQAHGLAFSVPAGVPIPPSLRNIYTEVASDTGTTPPASGNLLRWATQGVLLLNTTLTVHAGQAGSHHGWGWEQFTDAVIATVSAKETPVVFLLWGTHAQSKRPLIDEARHLVLSAAHPSPLSVYRGFTGCRHFSQTNTFLIKNGHSAILW
jgi:uracil-DNA glycosylase